MLRAKVECLAEHSKVETLPKPCLDCPRPEPPTLNLKSCENTLWARFLSCLLSLSASWAWKASFWNSWTLAQARIRTSSAVSSSVLTDTAEHKTHPVIRAEGSNPGWIPWDLWLVGAQNFTPGAARDVAQWHTGILGSKCQSDSRSRERQKSNSPPHQLAPLMLAAEPRQVVEDSQKQRSSLESKRFNSSSVPRVSVSEKRVNGCWLN